MSLQKSLSQSFWRAGLWVVGLIGVFECTLVQNAAAQSTVDSSVRRQSGGWQPTITTPQIQTAYYQTQGNLSDGLPVLPSAGQGMPAGNQNWHGGQLPDLPGLSAMPRQVSPPASPPMSGPPMSGPPSTADNIAPPQLPLVNRTQESSYPDRNSDANNGYNGPTGYRNQAPLAQSPGFPPQGNEYQGNEYQGTDNRGNNFQGNGYEGNGYQAGGATTAPPERSGGVPARLASTELRTIQNAGESPAGRAAADSFTSGLPYVTPPPRGRYATSPYQPAVFLSSEPRPSLVPAQLASTSSVLPPNSAATQGLRQSAPSANLIATQATMPNFVGAAPPAYLTAQQAALPQYRYPQPGVYPTAYQCTQPSPSFPSTGAVPGGYIPPTLPPNLAPNLYTPNNAGYRPLFSLGQENYNVQLGRGIIGQPTAYVPGQHIRNFLRYLSP